MKFVVLLVRNMNCTHTMAGRLSAQLGQCVIVIPGERERERERERETERDRQTDRQTDRDRQTERQAGRHTETDRQLLDFNATHGHL